MFLNTYKLYDELVVLITRSVKADVLEVGRIGVLFKLTQMNDKL